MKGESSHTLQITWWRRQHGSIALAALSLQEQQQHSLQHPPLSVDHSRAGRTHEEAKRDDAGAL